MRRAWFIIITGFLLAIAGYAGIYLARSKENHSSEKAGPLAWLQSEYHLSDPQFAHVCELYAAYQPRCAEMCRKIDEQNTRVAALLAQTNTITPDIKDALAKAAQLRAECQTAMLAHFYEVAQAMPPEEGKRYLDWVQQETLMPSKMPPTKQSSQSQ